MKKDDAKQVSRITSRIEEIDTELDTMQRLAEIAARDDHFQVGLRLGVNEQVSGLSETSQRPPLPLFLRAVGGRRKKEPKYDHEMNIDLRSSTALRVFSGICQALDYERKQLVERLQDPDQDQ